MPIHLGQPHTPAEAVAGLEAIFRDLQAPNRVTHDAWDWMEAGVCQSRGPAAVWRLRSEQTGSKVRVARNTPRTQKSGKSCVRTVR
jgi:hypothetical protein